MTKSVIKSNSTKKERKPRKKKIVKSCFGRCGKRPTKEVPWTLTQLRNTWFNMGRLLDEDYFEAREKNDVRSFYCKKLREDPEYCEEMMKVSKGDIVLRELYNKIRRVPLYLPFEEYQYKMDRLFRGYKWPRPKIVNKCGKVKPPKKGKEVVKKKPKNLKFTKTQLFIRAWMFPKMPTKGLLTVHSVGSGKTCSFVTGASSFIKKNWTVLVVTRTTLLQNMYKNMFEDVCEMNIRGKINQGIPIPEDPVKQKRMLSKSWWAPVSFKTFSNAMKGKLDAKGNPVGNDLFKKLVAKNGRADILKRTFIIIDEVHKLYGEDLGHQEKPDVKAIEKRVHLSYTISGENSCRLLLMTATPITKDPMELMKILNLLIPEKDKQFPTDYKKFQKEYMKQDGNLSQDGIARFKNRAKGLISYLDRTKDPTQFAQVSVNKVYVPMSGQTTEAERREKIKECEKSFDSEMDECKLETEFKKRNNCKSEARKKEKQCKQKIKQEYKLSDQSQLKKINRCEITL